MHIIYRPQFEKSLAKLPRKTIQLVQEMSDFFKEDPFHPSLRNHRLDPPMDAYWSITVESDLRIIYRKRDDETVIFYTIWTHHAVYER